MAPPAVGSISPSPFLDALELLGQCDDICRRLSIWGAAESPHDGPLTVLLRKHTQTLTAEFDGCKARMFIILESVADGDDTHVSTEIIRAMASTKLRILELLELHHFHNREDRKGHDGALNALFARRHILGDIAEPGTARAYYNEDKLVPIGFELVELVQKFLLPLTGGGIYSPDLSHRFL